MIGFREREQRSTSKRRFCGARAAIIFLWVILVSAVISLVLSIHDESSSSSYSIRPQRRERVLSRALFRAPSSPLRSTHVQVVGRNGPDTDADALYRDEKRVIHTGPNPLHN